MPLNKRKQRQAESHHNMISSKYSPNKKGFTLIELMITLTIIGLLSTIIYPSFSKIILNSKEKALMAMVHSIQLAIESYQFTTGQYPQKNNIQLIDLFNILKEEETLSKLPKNPFTNAPYTENAIEGKVLYHFNAEKNLYTLTGYSRDGSTIITTLTND